MQTEEDSRNRTALEQEQEKEKEQGDLMNNDHSDAMVIESSSQQLQAQSQLEISATEKVLINETLYYTEAAYKRVIETFDDCIAIIRSGEGELDNAFSLLDGIIQNAFIQFQISAKKMPEKFNQIFEETLERMKKDSQSYYSQLPKEIQGILDNHFRRLDTLLKLEKVETPACPKVTSMDPENLLTLFSVMQRRYVEQDRDLKKINEESNGIVIPTFDSVADFSTELSLI